MEAYSLLCLLQQDVSITHLYLCPLSGTWRRGFWSQCSQHQTWCHTRSSVQQHRQALQLRAVWWQEGGGEVVCRLRALWQHSDASQTSGRRAGSPRRGKLRPALVSSSWLILCGATRGASWTPSGGIKENTSLSPTNWKNTLQLQWGVLSSCWIPETTPSWFKHFWLVSRGTHVVTHDASYFTVSYRLRPRVLCF